MQKLSILLYKIMIFVYDFYYIYIYIYSLNSHKRIVILNNIKLMTINMCVYKILFLLLLHHKITFFLFQDIYWCNSGSL